MNQLFSFNFVIKAYIDHSRKPRKD